MSQHALGHGVVWTRGLGGDVTRGDRVGCGQGRCGRGVCVKRCICTGDDVHPTETGTDGVDTHPTGLR